MNNELYHYGVKGMKWGVRRYQNKDGSLTPAGKKRYDNDNDETIVYKTKNGEKIVACKEPPTAIAKFLAKLSPTVRAEQAKSMNCKIKNASNKTVGDLQLYRESPTSINVVWVSVNGKYEGRGYGTAVMNGVVNYAKQQKLKTVTLEVPGISPNARHIYEKLGFKSKGQISDSDDAWGGLTAMRLDLED